MSTPHFGREKHGLRGLTIQPSGKLIIYPVSFEHAGKYECAVVAGVHASRVHAHVFVESKQIEFFLSSISLDLWCVLYAVDRFGCIEAIRFPVAT